jgi:uncharacterized membrane protein
MTRNQIALGALAADLVASFALLGRLPERVPVHWNFHGEVDRWGSRWELLLFGPPLLVFLWALFAALPGIDPKVRAASQSADPEAPPAEQGSREAVFSIVLCLVAVLHVVALLQAAGVVAAGARLHALALSGLMLLLGNVLGRVRPNFFVGIRTPWTLADDQVWRRTHRLAGKTFFGGGLLALVAVAALPLETGFGAMIVLLVGASLWPVIASYLYWRGRQKSG